MNHSEDELKRALDKKRKSFNKESEDIDDDSINQVSNSNLLAMYVDLNLTARKYEKLKHHNEKIFGEQSYPPYKPIIESKNDCYPPCDHVSSHEAGAEVNFISLLENTTRRIIEQLRMENVEELSGKNLILIAKWGMDGASGQ